MLGAPTASLLTLSLALIWAIPEQGHVIGRLARISEFPQLPASVAQDLRKRGCRIPQAEGLPQPHNVLRGEFRRRGLTDWAVLCLQGDTSVILVYWNGSAGKPAELGPMDETISPSKNGYYRVIHVVGAAFIRKHYIPDMSAKPPAVIGHDAIDDGIYPKGSTIHYFHKGNWLELGGSD